VSSPTQEPLAVYRAPNRIPLDKVIDRIDSHCRAFIEISPWATLATADPDGWPDVSPRGGDAGFVKVLDPHTLVLPDRLGNNRVDSLKNLAANPRAALMFLVPGIDESLRVFGTTSLLAPDALDLDLTEFGREPRSVMVVTVQRAYLHCAKAVMRSGLWDPAARIDRAALPPFGVMIRDHCGLESPLPDDATIRADLALEL